MVSATRFDFASILETVPLNRFVPQIEPAPVATALGPVPTAMVAVTVLLARAMRDTVASRLFAAQTAPAPTAIPVGPLPTLIVWRAPVVGSRRETVPAAS